ncbi:MAG: hypothetical protein IIZ66_06845, partial [Clostridia bacterium]|nr:hypothetical protein [Clostridia bacterium]
TTVFAAFLIVADVRHPVFDGLSQRAETVAANCAENIRIAIAAARIFLTFFIPRTPLIIYNAELSFCRIPYPLKFLLQF